MDEVDDKLLLAAFHNGVNFDLFIHKLYEKEPQSMVELVHSTQNFMNAEDAIIAKKRKRVERTKANPMRHVEQGPRLKMGRVEEKKDQDNKKAGPSAQNQQYTPLNAPLEQVLMQIKDDPSLKWPEKIKGDPNKRIEISIVASIEIMGMIPMNVLTSSSRLRISLDKGN